MKGFILPKGSMAMAIKLDANYEPIMGSAAPIDTKEEEMFFDEDFYFDPIAAANGRFTPQITDWGKKMAKEGYAGITRFGTNSSTMWLLIVPYAKFEVG